MCVLQSPSDDGTCTPLVTEASCREKTSDIESDRSYCSWDENTSTCTFAEPNFGVKVSASG